MNFRQNFSQKKKIFRHFRKKTLAETVQYIPKGLRKGNPFHGPFAQLSYIHMIYNIYIYIVYLIYIYMCVTYAYIFTYNTITTIVVISNQFDIRFHFDQQKIVSST